MKLKTYTAETMAQALAHVRKDLGKDAMILHTRSYRVGAWFGLGGKSMVEITASSPNAIKSRAPRKAPRVATQVIEPKPLESKPIEQRVVQQKLEEQRPEIVIQRGRTITRQRLAAQGIGPGESPVAVGTQIDHETDISGRDALFADNTKTETPSRQAPRRGSRSTIKQPPLGVNTPTAPPVDPTNNDLEINIPKSTTNRFTDRPVASAMIPKTPKRTRPNSVDKKNVEPTNSEDEQTNGELRSQIDTLQKMMGQVLESTRKTAVAVGSSNPEAALPSGEMPAPLFALYSNMIDNDVPVDLVDNLVGSVRDRLDAIELKDSAIVRQALLREIESTIRTRSESLLHIETHSKGDRPRVIALVGPTGVGKTTTVAKLAATYKLRHNKQVGLVTSDTYRIAAVEQLRTYAGIIGLPLKVANSPEEMERAIADLGDCDIVVVDTAGRSQNDARRLDELAEFTAAAAPDETHLVLSTTVGDNVLRKTAERFKALGPDRCILTKLDEAVTTGPIAGLSDRIGLPLSFITVGQEVPDDLEPARADRLARCVLDGPEAVVRRWSEDNG
ncbi:MAG: flagellar biosynthesis protein FlhF [Phycisphaerales bacterium]|nr:flagellar biosynthesis protein FlhF [Phycisphaerales bacterium]